MRKNRGKIWRLILATVCLAAAGLSFSQTESQTTSPPVEILKLKWEKQIRLPRGFDPSIIQANGTFGDSRNPLSPTATAGTTINAADATRAATKARADAAETGSVFPVTPGRLPVFYSYSIRVRNASSKTILGIAWDYLFFDATGGKPLGEHQFLSYQKVAAGRTVTFQRSLRSPPVRLVDASTENSGRRKFPEKAVIECILYSDTTFWRNTNAHEGICDLLRSNAITVAH